MPAVPAAPTTVDVAAFDPYAAAIPLRWLRKVRNGVLLLLAPVVAGLLAASAAVGGMLGDGGDFQPLDDFWRAVGRNDLTVAEGLRYPLVRDTLVWLFAAVMVAEIMIMHRQWRLFTTCIPKLITNKVIKPRHDVTTGNPDDPPILRFAVGFPPEQRLARYLERTNARNRRHAAVFTAAFVLAAFVLAALLSLGQYYGSFRIFVPEDGTAAQREQWRRDAYAHWWAGIDQPVGAVTYFLLAALAIYMILAQTHVGVSIARIAAALPRLAQLDANWINPDGHYGWEPVRHIFRTVWLSMALYGIMVSGLAVVLGLGSGGWIPAAFWFVLLWIYVGLPWLGIRRIEAAARERHIAMAEAEAEGASTRELDELEARVERYRNARIRPMRLGSFARIPVLLSVTLPVLLNVFQPYVEKWLGH
ncbi:hypothetical protein [Actinophytocola sp.]|uniref:hypothetical protein n=1 Tax=Actinophytocola sp. TaxID=1872138 RepID=UPI002D4B04CD|nr:hypothetical protein [Actinophytocola sp.]HYQ61818.1 hypothetical protein [Actinophytocola sp.]